MRIVVDTNVLVSAFISPFGSPGRIVDLLLAGTLTAVMDDRIFAEYREVLRRPRFEFDKEKVEFVLDYFNAEGDFVSACLLNVDIPDKDDLMFVEVAATPPKSAIVTGNRKDFPSQVMRKLAVTIFDPADLLNIVQ